MNHLDFDITTISKALLARVDDVDQTTLFKVAEVRAALLDIDPDARVDELAPLVNRPVGDMELGLGTRGRLDDVRLLQQRIRQHAEPDKVAALASGLDLEAATVVAVCRASGVEPSRAMAIAIAVRDGDAKAAYLDVTTNWPDVEGGWERHTHPSLQTQRHLTAVTERKPTRDILDRWTGRSRPAVPQAHLRPIDPS